MDSSTKEPITLSVFLPFYNEEKNIEPVVSDTISFLRSHPRIKQFEVIMVNDGSKDETLKRGEELIKKFPEARLVSHVVNRGYGGAVKTGIESSRLDYIFFMDGDGQFNIREIDKLLLHIPHYKVVIGYRENRQDSFQRKINTALWGKFIRLILGLRVKDIDCAFKIFKKEVISDFDLVSEGAMISSELLVRIMKKNVPIKEVPITHYPRKEGKPTGAGIKVIFRAFKELFKLYPHL